MKEPNHELLFAKEFALYFGGVSKEAPIRIKKNI